MIRISETVEQILKEDGFAMEALQRGLLNASAYAKSIHKIVEERAMKPVRLGTIIVALARITEKVSSQDFNPKITIDTFNVTSSLIEITYERTEQNTAKLMSLNKSVMNKNDFFTVTEGLHEITIICSGQAQDTIINHFDMKPKIVIDDLVAISVRFSDKYIEVPNTIYSLVGALAVRHINVMEIISTYTELTFVVYANELEETIRALQTYSQK